MSKSKKIIVIILFILVIICVILTIIGINYTKPNPNNPEVKEEVKPPITVEYTTVELNTLKEYNNYLDFEDNKVSYYDNNYRYIVYKNGVILQEPERIKDNNNKYEDYIDFKKYIFYITEGYEESCIKDKSNNEIECFDEVQKISNLQDSTDYLILTKYDPKDRDVHILTLLNPNTGEIIDLSKINVFSISSSSLSNDESGNIYTYEYDYLPACSSFEKCGLINYQGKIIIDYIYDNVDYINKDTIIVSKNDKTGIINYKNEILLPIEYDQIQVTSNHIIAIKDFNLSVFNKKMKQLLTNVGVDSSESETGYNYYLNIQDDNLYILVEEDNNNTLYLVNSKFQRKIESTGTLEYVYNDYALNKLKYISFSYTNNNKLYIVFYDLDLYEYYTFTKELTNNIDFYTSISVTEKNNNYYIISLIYDIDKYNEYHYIDLINSKEIDEITAIGKHFSNGYTYTIIPNKLNIYKDKELLNSFTGYFTHLNEYTFIQSINDTYKIINLEFKKESREVEN